MLISHQSSTDYIRKVFKIRLTNLLLGSAILIKKLIFFIRV